MRINSKYIYGLLGVSLALTGCNSEELTSPAEVGNGKTTHVTLTVSRPTDKTRTTLDKTEDGRALTSTWDKDDQLVVINSANKKLGELTLEGDGGSAEGVFSGELTDVVSEGQYTLWYLGASNDGNAPYASVSVNDGVATVVNSLGNAKGCKVAGTFADLRRADLMKRDNVKLTVKGDEAYAAEDITLASQNAMAHFKLSGVSTFSTNDELTVSYGNYSYKVATVGTDIYLPLIPGNYAFTFNLTSGSNAYTATIGNNTSIVAGTYYSATTATAQGTGIEVTLKKVETSEPLVEGVGPVIEYGGKSWRFTRGNLKYTLSTDQWTILDNQAAYVNAGGLGVATSKETSNECKPGTTPDDIGLFAWGATGVEDAQKPWTLRHGSTSKPTSSYWPSFLRTNSTITNLVDPDASYVYDFGHAYMAKGRPANDKREYITPPAEVITALMKECFVQGATLKKMGENGADVKGLICIPGKPTAAEVKKMINGENGVGGIDGATCSNSMTQEAIHNSNGSTLNYGNITITDYAALKKINDAVFFPAASKRNYYSQVYKSDNYGYYWTASGHSGGTNAYDLHFYGPGDTNGVFYYSGIKNPSNISRDQQLAVRLLVEVIEETVEK